MRLMGFQSTRSKARSAAEKIAARDKAVAAAKVRAKARALDRQRQREDEEDRRDA